MQDSGGQPTGKGMLNLRDLPHEVLHNILLRVSPTTILAFQQTCRQFITLDGPLLWRHICLTNFKYWSAERHISTQLSLPVDRTDWKGIFAERYQINREISQYLNSILASQNGRTAKTWNIVRRGLDAKDTLLQHLHVHDDAEDVLARRWYSRVALKCLHRSEAIEQWIRVRDDQQHEVSLEAALGAFDLFVIQDGHGDLESISESLGKVVKAFLQSNPGFADLTMREKATAVADYLRSRHLLGIDGDVDAQYHNLQNNFIGIALHSAHHPSLPLISVAIYCCVAQRLGLEAHPCSFPFHVLAIIKSPHGVNLDNQLTDGDKPGQIMYMDPFRSSNELSVDVLMTQLKAMGAPNEDYDRLLSVAPMDEIVARCAQNIMISIRTSHDEARSGSSTVNSAFYAALWAFLILPSKYERRTAVEQQQQYLPVLLQHMEAEFPTDVCLIEKTYESIFKAFGHRIDGTLQAMRATDFAPKPVKMRDPKALKHVLYKVGQVFRHHRYQYNAVITGWDVECAASEDWISQNRVNDLNRGQHQSFYHVLVEDETPRYVAQENIEVIQEKPENSLIALAGRYFKCWDANANCFVSNIRDEYPND